MESRLSWLAGLSDRINVPLNEPVSHQGGRFPRTRLAARSASRNTRSHPLGCTPTSTVSVHEERRDSVPENGV